jgi:hypothetical protein
MQDMTNFMINGISYYYQAGEYYADNIVVCETITRREFRKAQMDWMINQ